MSLNNILELKDVTKIYPGVTALNNVSISFKKGEVHALLGENGAGKSTLIKVITGAIEPTNGTITYKGDEHNCFSPSESLSKGIGAIYQEFNLIPYLSVAENVYYGRELMKGSFIDKQRMNKETNKLLKEFDIDIDPKSKVKDLGVAYQQIVEIVKSVSQNVEVLIMDEPTAPLTNKEINSMFKIVDRLKKNNVTIIYISHRMEEIFEICDRVTILRDGNYIDTKNIIETNKKELIAKMVGRELGESYPQKQYQSDEIIMQVDNLCNEKIKNVTFKIKKGEILGLGGLVGAGRTEIARAIFGADKRDCGDIYLNGQKVNPSSPSEAIKYRIGLIPEDRKNQGVLLSSSVKDNISFSCLDLISKMNFIDNNKELKLVNKLTNELKIKTPSLNQTVSNLSGGNQQKVVLAKWLARDCEVLIFDEPTRGIDVGAKQEIYNLMKEMAERGKGIIMISSEMPELLGMADRILVMHEGQISGVLEKDDFSQEKILELASGS